MKRRRRLLMVAGALVAISVISLIVIEAIGAGEVEPRPIRIWNTVITSLLAFFLVLGKNSARWFIIISTGFGALGGFIVCSTALAIGGFDVPHGNVLLAWLGIVTVAYGVICGYLLYSRGIAREMRRIAERIE